MSAERDRAFYLDETFREAYRRSLREGFSQGAQGYARDLVNTLGPWPVSPEDITVPVDLWCGGLDTVDASEGGSILWTRAGDILARLSSHP